MGWWKMDSTIAQRGDLSPASKLVYAYLTDRQGENDAAWPSQATIGKACNLSVRGVRKCLAQLAKAGLVSVEIRAGQSNFYSLTPEQSAGVVGREPRNKVPTPPEQSAEVPRNKVPTIQTGIQTQDSDNTPPTPQRGKASRPTYDPVAHFAELTAGTCLDTDAVRQAWADWVAYRRERRKPLTKMTVARQVAQLRDAGAVGTCNAIEESIQHGWQGLFPGRAGNRRPAGRGDSRPAWRQGELRGDDRDVPTLHIPGLPGGNGTGAGPDGRGPGPGAGGGGRL